MKEKKTKIIKKIKRFLIKPKNKKHISEVLKLGFDQHLIDSPFTAGIELLIKFLIVSTAPDVRALFSAAVVKAEPAVMMAL